MNSVRAATLLVLLLAGVARSQAPADDVLLSPDDVLVQIAADLRTVPAAVAPYQRYASLRVHETAKERDEVAKLFAAQVHDLSRKPTIYPLKADPASAMVRVSTSLIRFDVRVFGPDFENAWERLGEQEPYWHGVSLVPAYEDGTRDVEYGYWVRRSTRGHRSGGGREHRDEYWITTEVKREPTKKAAFLERGFFLRTAAGKEAFKYIQTVLVDPRNGFPGTDVPVVDADWFVTQTAADDQRVPGYHDFLNFDNLAEWERLVGLVKDAKAIDPNFLVELREAVAHSGVGTDEVIRRIEHLEKPGGDVWYTLDVNQRRHGGDPNANPFKQKLDGLIVDAIETLGHLSNGFVAKGLFNGQGVRQDVAPDFIATDTTAPYQDRRVHAGLCMRCHVTGFQDFKSWFRDMEKSRLASKNPKELQDLQDSYVRRMEPFLKLSRDRYAAALFEATGLTPAEFSAILKRTWKAYGEDHVTLAMAARRLGVTEETARRAINATPLREKMQKEGKPAAEIDAAVYSATSEMDALLALYREGDSHKPIVFQQQVFQRMADTVQGKVRPFAIRFKEEKR